MCAVRSNFMTRRESPSDDVDNSLKETGMTTDLSI